MLAELKSHLQNSLSQALAVALPDQTLPAASSLGFDRPKQASHGDLATNVALQLAKPAGLNPRELATRIVAALPTSEWIARAEIAGPGFINLFLTPAAKLAAVKLSLQQGAAFGRSTLGGQQHVQVEFVSANPTGPLHVGHGRGAAYGASLANVLEYAGWKVTREYYVNDAGRQMDILAVSTWLRYLALFGVAVPFPPNGYQGDYVKDMARSLQDKVQNGYLKDATIARITADAPDVEADKEGHLDTLIANAKKILGDDWAVVHRYVLDEQLADGRDDLAEFGVNFDVWFSEKSLFDNGDVERAVAELAKRGHTYEKDGALWFRSTDFGDEKDRVVRRENGIYTYFASDIAYHANKLQRFDRVIDIWGADHHGYIPRVKGALQALGLPTEGLDIALVQFAVLYRDGQKASMSTRSGEFVTLRELRAEVGNDATRFFYVLRKSDQHLDFDLDLAKSQSNENPVYYIQYAHARLCSVLNQWAGDVSSLQSADLSKLESEREQALAQRLGEFGDVIESAARDYAPHQIAFYLKDLAADFHSYYNADRVLVDDEGIKLARLALCQAVRQALVNGLSLIGVSAPQTM